MSRDKGKRGEAEVAHLLQTYGHDAKRGCQYHGGPDSPDVVGLPGYHIEVKRTERLDLYGAMEQAKRDAGSDTPVVFHRRNGKEWVVILRAEDWLEGVKHAELLHNGTKDTGRLVTGVKNDLNLLQN